MGVDNITLFPVGLEVADETDYSKLGGLNLGKQYIVTLGTPTRLTDIKDPDKWGYERMLELAPPAYHPQREIKTAVG